MSSGSLLKVLFEKYQNIFLTNVDIIGQLETTLRTLLFLAPGRFRESEVKLEGAYTGLSLLSFLHDYITLKFLKKLEQSKKLPLTDLPPSECIPFAKWISVLQYSQLFIELLAKQKGAVAGKWTAVFMIEVVKAIMKLLLLRSLEGHTVVYYQIPSHRDAPQLRELIKEQAFLQKEKEEAKKANLAPIKRRDRPHVNSEKWEEFKNQTKVISEQKLFNRKAPIGETIAEVLHIVRPVVYLCSMYRYGRNSWKAWLTSLFLDFLSLAYYFRNSRGLNTLQKDEMSRRTSLLFFYLLRSPFFESVTMRSPGPVKRLANGIGSLPLLSTLFGSLSDFISVYREHYFYTSAT